MNNCPIATEKLTVAYGKKRVFADVSLTVERGSVYALLGRNGEGKTTLVRCLLGQLPPRSGHARLFGRDAWRRRAANMRSVALVPESPNFPPQVRVTEVTRFLSRVQPRWDQAAVDTELDVLGIAPNRCCDALSRGQKTQLAIALALASKPRLLICDDPTLGLDAVAHKQLIDRLIVELAENGTTILLTTHDLQGVGSLADRIGILHHGTLIVDEPLESLRQRFRRLEFETPESGDTARDRFATMAPLPTPKGAWSSQKIVARYDPSQHPPGATAALLSLEEIFVALTGQRQEADHA